MPFVKIKILISCLNSSCTWSDKSSCQQSVQKPANMIILTSVWQVWYVYRSLHWRHNDQDGVSNQQPHGCLLNRLFRCKSKKTSNLRVTGLCAGNSPGPVNSPHKGPVTRKMNPFDDVIMDPVIFKWLLTPVQHQGPRVTLWRITITMITGFELMA